MNFNLTYRIRPQHSTYLDTGYILLGGTGDLVWLYEVEFDANCANDVTMQLYISDVQKGGDFTITADANVRKPYIVPFLRGTKGYRPRLVFKTAASDGAGAIGFECYGIRIRMGTTGNQEGAEYRTVYPVNQAP